MTTQFHSLPPAGWYADPHGAGRRYWNGQAWTADVLPHAPVAPPPPVVAPALVAPPLVAPTQPRLRRGIPSTQVTPMSLNQSLVLSLIGVALVFVSGFMTWATGYVYGQKTGSENGWSGRAPWAAGGPDSLEIAQWLAYGTPASGTSDFLLILVLAVAGGVTASLAMRGGSHRLVQATVALGVLCAVLVFSEMGAFHNAGSDIGDLLGADVDVKAGLGAYVCLFGSALIAGGAVRHALQQHKRAVA